MPSPVAAFIVSADRRIRQTLLALAASAGVRVQALDTLPEGSPPAQAPTPPLYLFGSDQAELVDFVPREAVTAIIAFDTHETGNGIRVLRLPAQESIVLQLLVHAANIAFRNATVIEVRGVTGGAGTTTAAVLLANAAAGEGHAVTLVETGGLAALELALGLENQQTVRWGNLTDSAGELRDLPNPDALRLALPRWRSVAVLACGPDSVAPSHGAVGEVVAALARAPGIIIVDAGTHPGADVPPRGSARPEISMLVVPRTVAAVVRAHRVVGEMAGRPPVVVTRPRRGSLIREVDVRRALSAPVIGEIPEISSLQNLVDRGQGAPGPQARCWPQIRNILRLALETVSDPRPELGQGMRARPPQLRVVQG